MYGYKVHFVDGSWVKEFNDRFHTVLQIKRLRYV